MANNFKLSDTKEISNMLGNQIILIRIIWNASSQLPKPGLSLLTSIVAWEVHRDDPSAGEHPATETHYTMFRSLLLEIADKNKNVQCRNHIMADGLRKQLEPGECQKYFFISQICARKQINIKPSEAAIRATSLYEDEQQSLKENARSLIVNYHCEASNHGRGNSTKRLFSPSTHSRFLEVLSDSINFAAQGLCEGTPVVSRSCRCSEQIGCIFE
jgi:hypothetical protein